MPPFVAYAIPREEVAWIGHALMGVTTPDAVRAVFEEARTRFTEGAASAEDIAPADEPTIATLATDGPDALADLAVALQRLGILPAATQQAQVIEQVRDLRAQVAEALKAS